MNQLVTINFGVKKDYVDLDLPEITMVSTGQKGQVITASAFKGGMTLTVRPHKTEDVECEVIDNRNCVFNIKRIEDRMKELGALEDIECEVLPSQPPINNP